MKKYSVFAVTLLIMISFLFFTNSAWAGSKHSYRLGGVAIGIGAAILGHALIKNHKNYSPPDPVYHSPKYRRHSSSRYSRHRGYWEVHKEWVPPSYQKVWNPGHYSPNGQWIEAHWMKIVDQSGYWQETKVWVAGR